MKKLYLLISIVPLFSVASVWAKDIGYDFSVGGMTCAACVARVEKEFRIMEGIKTAQTDLDLSIIRVCSDERVTFSDEQLKALFEHRGFTYNGMTKREGC